MGKKKRSYKAEPFEALVTNDHFTRMYDTQIKSEAYKDLRHSSRTVLLILRMQYKGYDNTVQCPYTDFKEYGLNSETVKRAIADLEQHGFIKCERGRVAWRDDKKSLHQTPNEYTFSTEWRTWTKSQSTKTP